MDHLKKYRVLGEVGAKVDDQLEKYRFSAAGYSDVADWADELELATEESDVSRQRAAALDLAATAIRFVLGMEEKP